ncbi:protein of unknown function [Cupriavidus neocaledonicus]|uniref:Uncharacterized protein n=1 Tax=Cupriavidus neocaledonicus TaxID=1040979 RepID=A0A375H4T9_9BURK|nr:protein of unknown function [Cupriavidus neocaledonicus]
MAACRSGERHCRAVNILSCIKKNLHMTTAVRPPVVAAACCGIKYWGSH